MILLDTNIFMCLANGTIRPGDVKNTVLTFPSIVKIEALGYARITVVEQNHLKELFAECRQLELEEAVVQRAITLRQQFNMSLGDAIVAATALVYDIELWTANTADFSRIEDLRLYNPLEV